MIADLQNIHARFLYLEDCVDAAEEDVREWEKRATDPEEIQFSIPARKNAVSESRRVIDEFNRLMVAVDDLDKTMLE